MSEPTPPTHQPTPAEQERFELLLPPWLGDHLDASDAAWMQAMQQQYPALKQQAVWQKSLQTTVRAAAAAQDTGEAWALLQQKMAAAAREDAVAPPQPPHPAPRQQPPPRWLAWLFTHPSWANGLAALAVAVVVGQATWMAWPQGEDASQPAWRSLDIDTLAPATEARLAVQLTPASPAQVLAEITALIAPAAGPRWEAAQDGSWVLHITPAPQDIGPLLERIRAHASVTHVQRLP